LSREIHPGKKISSSKQAAKFTAVSIANSTSGL
jgi:hypothetical protein